MFMRTSSILLTLLVLSACGKPDNEVLAEAEQAAADQAANDGKIKCAINGDSNFTDGCETERLSGEDGVTMIVRHPDGGFRRFNVLTDGRGLEAADGSETAKIEIVEGDKIMVSVGTDKYLMPARMKTEEKAGANEVQENAENPQAGS